MGNVADVFHKLRDMAADDDGQSNVEFAKAFQGKVRTKEGKKPRHPSREATTAIDEAVERIFIPKSVVPWDIIDATIDIIVQAITGGLTFINPDVAIG